MEKPPNNTTAGDAAHEIRRAVISAIPVVGGPLQVFFESIFTAPLEKRKQAWLERLATVVEEVQSQMNDLTPEKLATNEAFITVAMQASQVAIRNHQQTKLEALQNAVLHSALPNSPDENEQLIFIRLIDQLTPWHLSLLVLLNNPVSWMQRNNLNNPGWGMGGVSTVIEFCIPELRGRRDIYDHLVSELQAEGLVGQGQFVHTTMTGHGMLESRTTRRGKAFINYISP